MESFTSYYYSSCVTIFLFTMEPSGEKKTETTKGKRRPASVGTGALVINWSLLLARIRVRKKMGSFWGHLMLNLNPLSVSLM